MNYLKIFFDRVVMVSRQNKRKTAVNLWLKSLVVLCKGYMQIFLYRCWTFLKFFMHTTGQSWAPQAKVLGSRYLKEHILNSRFLLQVSAQNLVLDLKYTKWTWPLSLSNTNLANSLIFLSKPSVFSQYYQQNNVDVCSFH